MKSLVAIGIMVAGLGVSLLGCYFVDGMGLVKFMVGFFMMLGGFGGAVAYVLFRRVL
jgi:hypothetical protein